MVMYNRSKIVDEILKDGFMSQSRMFFLYTEKFYNRLSQGIIKNIDENFIKILTDSNETEVIKISLLTKVKILNFAKPKIERENGVGQNE